MSGKIVFIPTENVNRETVRAAMEARLEDGEQIVDYSVFGQGEGTNAKAVTAHRAESPNLPTSVVLTAYSFHLDRGRFWLLDHIYVVDAATIARVAGIL